MQIPAEITWHNMEPARHVAARVNKRVARLEQFFDRITRCNVVVEAAHQRHRQGNCYEVRVDVTVPGGELSVSRKPGDDDAHEDVLVAVRDAFDAMERQLRRWKDQHKGRPEEQAGPLQGRIAEIDHDRDFGQIAAADGRLVYFHRNAVVAGDFDAMRAGDTVELVVDRGEDAEGAHASTVRAISPGAFVERRG
jgi:ribosomal subunit interface protein